MRNGSFRLGRRTESRLHFGFRISKSRSDPSRARSLFGKASDSIMFHFRQFLPRSQAELDLLANFSKDPAALSGLSRPIRKHGEELAREDLYPARTYVPLMRQLVMMSDVMPSESRTSQKTSVVAGGTESTVSGTGLTIEHGPPRKNGTVLKPKPFP